MPTFSGPFLATVLLAAATAPADAAAFHHYGALTLNPAGTRIATLESATDPATGSRSRTVVTLRDARSGQVLAQYDPCHQCSYDQPAFSAHGDRLAFIASDAATHQAFVYATKDGVASRIGMVEGIANSARFAPDGGSVAFLATLHATKQTGAVEAGARQVGEIGHAPDEQRLARVPAGGGAVTLLSPADIFIYAYDWTPDSHGFAVISAQGDGDNNFWIAQLNYLDATTHTLRLIAAPSIQMNRPQVSPDGRQVALIGGLMCDFGDIGGDVYTVPLAGGTPVNTTQGRKASYNAVHWSGRTLLGAGTAAANAIVDRIDPDTARVTTLWQAPVATNAGEGGFAFAADNATLATVVEDYVSAPRIVAGPVAAPRPITHDNDAFGARIAARSVTWISDGVPVQGWLLTPRELAPGKQYPMIVSIHGGPANLFTPRYVGDGELSNPTLRAMVGAGYLLFLPNPRGSLGQGAAFVEANRKDFGGGDWRDIERGIDAVLASAPVDPDRLGITGHSYGGFMTMWAVTHSQRFKAAVASAGIANWISYYGQNGIDQWMIPYFGASAYDAPELYRRASPIESIKHAHTPTLLYAGENDLECPSAQSFEFWKGLKAMGVPTTLVVYPGEGHTVRQPEHQRDQRARLLAWFQHYLH